MQQLANILDQEIPLAPNQKFMLLTNQGKTSSGYTNITTAFSIDNTLDVSLVVETLRQVVNDNPAFRLRIVRDSQGDHAQELRPSANPETFVFDYSGISLDSAIEMARVKASELAWQPFPSEEIEAVRTFAISIPQSTIVGFITNHVFSDMISMRALKKQFIDRLRHNEFGTTPAPSAAPQYTDFAAQRAKWDREWRAQPQAEHWLNLLAALDGSRRAFNPPTFSKEDRDLPIALGENSAGAFADMSRDKETTDFILVLSIFVVSALYLNSGENIPVAVARDERPNLSYFRTVGNFAALVPFFVEISLEDAFIDVVKKVKAEWAVQSKLKWTPSELIWRFLTRTQSPFILDYISIEESTTLNEAVSNFHINRPPKTMPEGSIDPADAMREGTWDNLFFVKKSPNDMFYWSWAGEEFGYSGSPILRIFDRLGSDLLRHPDQALSSTFRSFAP